MFASLLGNGFQQNHPPCAPLCRSSPIKLPIATKRLWMCSNKAEIHREMFQKCFKHSTWHETKFPAFLSIVVMNRKTYYRWLAWQSTSLEWIGKIPLTIMVWIGGGVVWGFFSPLGFGFFSFFLARSSKSNTIFLREGTSYKAEVTAIRGWYSGCQWLLNTDCTLLLCRNNAKYFTSHQDNDHQVPRTQVMHLPASCTVPAPETWNQFSLSERETPLAEGIGGLLRAFWGGFLCKLKADNFQNYTEIKKKSFLQSK